jgi:hypothetical protein
MSERYAAILQLPSVLRHPNTEMRIVIVCRERGHAGSTEHCATRVGVTVY